MIIEKICLLDDKINEYTIKINNEKINKNNINEVIKNENSDLKINHKNLYNIENSLKIFYKYHKKDCNIISKRNYKNIEEIREKFNPKNFRKIILRNIERK